jgi:hypothetical protein
MYPIGADSNDVRSPPYATKFENLYNLVNHLLFRVHGDQTKPPTPHKHHNKPLVPSDAVFKGGSVEEYATHVLSNSTKTAYIDPRDWIDLIPTIAFNDISPPGKSHMLSDS